MLLIGLRLDPLDAVLITHEHTDHINGLARLAARLKVPVFISEATLASLPAKKKLPAVEYFRPGHSFQIGDVLVEPFTIPHDAVDPVGFRFTSAGVRIAQATDLGYITPNVKDMIRGCHALILESNHDLEMLRNGPYPWYVKQRVMSRDGHLSNSATADYLRDEFDAEARLLILAHLSEQNNHPQIARLEASSALEQRDATDTRLVVSSQTEPTEVFTF